MARRDPVGIRLLTRRGNDWSSRFPLIVEAVNHLKVRSCLIDGEVVCCDERERDLLAATIGATRDGRAIAEGRGIAAARCREARWPWIGRGPLDQIASSIEMGAEPDCSPAGRPDFCKKNRHSTAVRAVTKYGRWTYLERLRGSGEPPDIFCTILGVGPTLAKRLHETLHVETLGATRSRITREERQVGCGNRPADARHEAHRSGAGES